MATKELRDRAVELRQAGWTVPAIAQQFGAAKSTSYLWVRHLPIDRDSAEVRERRREHSKRMTDAPWDEHRRVREAAPAETAARAAAWVKTLRYRELILLGAAIYWCEGTTAAWSSRSRGRAGSTGGSKGS